MLDLPFCDLNLPDALGRLFTQQWERFISSLSDQQKLSVADYFKQQPTKSQQLAKTWIASDFVLEQCVRNPEVFIDLLNSGDLERIYPPSYYRDRLAELVEHVDSEEQLMTMLRRFRQREQMRIIWRDVQPTGEMTQTTLDVSQMADAVIDCAINWLYPQACAKWGTPLSTVDGQPVAQQLVVLGMGKLGAHELNLSSDIDLIFTYEGKGQTEGASKSLDNQEFFIRLGQRLIHVLDARTADGYVFRVDMRLRPYGDSGALVLNFDAMSEYYQSQGRDWERYAMIKARVIAGDQAAGARLMEELRPFVYRRYIDFSVIDSLRSMKELIRREEQRRGLEQDVKLGSGGIREVEFIAQVFQLIRGGRDQRLQQRSLLKTLHIIADLDLLPPPVVDGLVAAYYFLRNTEHALQALRDEQTQKLPKDELAKQRTAFALGYQDWQAFFDQLTLHRNFVFEQFNHLIAPPESEEASENTKAFAHWQALWRQELDPSLAKKSLAAHGFEETETVFDSLSALYGSRKVQSLQPIPQQRLDNFMPRMLAALANDKQPHQTLKRLLALVESVLRRTAYLVLLVENPSALQQLIRLCSASPWIAEELARHPILLDELLDVRELYHPADPDALKDELRQQLLRIPADDVEQQMESLRYFKRAHVLRVAASEVSNMLPLMKVSDYLTYIAEAVLNEVLQLAWSHLVAKYGTPQMAPGVHCDPNFIIVAYGKLGGLELSYGSDLDLVFLDDSPSNLSTDGDKPIENSVFFTRLAQRIIHLLTTFTAAGQLYEVDMRLRPSGASGLLVTSLDGFEHYQRNQAWTWEHQALTRARVIAGSPALQQKFELLRAQILAQPRDEADLKQQVMEMRKKICETHGSGGDAESVESQFDLKYDPGGIVDIEFIVQFAVLAWSQKHPKLLQYTDNIRILENLEQLSLIAPQDAESLREAYKAFRSVIHRLTLDQQPARLSVTELRKADLDLHRLAVVKIWQLVMATTL
ncbi:MAG: bifunctional [glutamate--ammonia ligase]-adenylyl-L-tyrosine phosphorylase/[glutamate--ammonia-ligase] adenylyltransferase [Pseudomonadales bacterium]|nr:bifunctional [glutamate--ammonia ligase]-adenylyl-L-tyrosine phosphorylase/[glutamate--ammonia-ligase] adenylyltransferase [Pseudomonadales bacterium]